MPSKVRCLVGNRIPPEQNAECLELRVVSDSTPVPLYPTTIPCSLLPAPDYCYCYVLLLLLLAVTRRIADNKLDNDINIDRISLCHIILALPHSQIFPNHPRTLSHQYRYSHN